MVPRSNRRSKAMSLVLVCLAGGSTFSACQSRLKEDTLNGISAFVTGTLLDAGTINCLVFQVGCPESQDDDGDT